MNQIKLFDLPLFDVQLCDIEDLFKYKLNEINSFLTEKEKDIFCSRVCDYYHNVVGFPYYGKEINIDKEFDRLKKYDVNRILLDNNELQQVMLGLNICNFYHPHMWDVKCRNQKTPKEVFFDKELFKKAIKKRLMMSDSKLRIFNVRKSLKIFSGSQSVSNFRPTIAEYLYMKYCSDGAVVLDPCMGYGGRLLGAIISSKVLSYHGIDPCFLTYKGNKELDKKLNMKNDNQFYNIPFEDFTTNISFDLIFTSPPYFNVEKYSNEPTQSYIRYPLYSQWVEGFLRPLIEKSYNYLKKNKYFILNVHGDKIIQDVNSLCVATGFKLKEILQMRLSKLPGKNVNKTDIKFKTEPIFIWRK
jgi:hypothetical protein